MLIGVHCTNAELLALMTGLVLRANRVATVRQTRSSQALHIHINLNAHEE